MTTATLRPDATLSTPDSLTGAASAHAATNDDSDASYYTDNDVLAGATILTLGTVALPAGSVTKQARVRCRVRGNSTTAGINFAFGPSSPGGTASVTVAATFASFDGPWVPVTYSQADVDALRTWTWTSTQGNTYHAAELYVDVVYVTIPVVALDAITDPYTASTIVAASWVNTLDSDGGGQTHYRIWATDDNDGDAIVYDSGVVASSATTADVGPLPDNEGQYTIHVQVAQTVNAAQHWSAEDSQAAVTLAVDTADINAITATPNDATGLIAIEVTWDAATETPELIEVERTADAGDTWEPVRFATLQDWTGAAAFEVDDHEAPPETDVTYRARATYYAAGAAIVGSWTETAAPVSWTATACWVKSPTNPALNRTFQTARPMEAQWAEAVGVHDLLGPNGGRVVIVGPAVMPTASLTVHTPTEADATALKAIFAHSPFVLVHAPPAWQYDVDYCAAVGRSRARLVAKNWVPHTQWPLQLIACNAPADHTAGSL